MKKTGIISAILLSILAFLAPGRLFSVASAAAAPAPKVLLDPSLASAASRFKPTSSQVTVSRSQAPSAPGLVVTIQPGKETYPGASLQPEGAAPWNLSAYGHVEARIVNTGAQPLSITLRVDNAGNWSDNPYNAESINLKPGTSGTVSTIFGFSFGRQPGFALNPAAVVNLLIFATKSDAPQSFRIESISAAGPAGEKPPVDPRSIRIKPAGGVLLGPGAAIDPAKQIEAQGAEATLTGGTGHPALRAAFGAKPSRSGQLVRIKPAEGRWDLRDALEIRVQVRNAGTVPVTPRVRVESNGGQTDWLSSPAPLAPGASSELIVPFINSVTWQGPKTSSDRKIWSGQRGTGNPVANDAIAAVVLSPGGSARGAVLEVDSVRAVMPPTPALPEWLGQRPPVEGDWVKTFDEEFTGPAIDLAKWDITGPNYWDKTTHWSKDNLILGGGLLRMRYEKKTGPHNDDPKQKSSNYACGFIETYGKWAQRYGYFEARMKLPTAPGLWPAFWMMPDRDVKAGPQNRRQDTANGGMEFDIMEHLTRWGGSRYNIAMHWDGYGKDHKSTGSEHIYVQPDKDGFITAGLLWLPGQAVFYGNGREVARWESPRICTVPCDMMFTLPTGGWDNNRLDDKKLPDDFVIDYVRAWQRRDLQQ